MPWKFLEVLFSRDKHIHVAKPNFRAKPNQQMAAKPYEERNAPMKKRILMFLMAMLVALSGLGLTASAKGLPDHISVTGYDSKVDYMAKIIRAMNGGGPYAMEIGAIFERQRNMKIEAMGMDYQKTTYFDDYSTPAQVLKAIEEDRKPKPTYSDEDLDLLARIINAEAGCDWIPDWVQQMVGSVVLNRVNSALFPNTIREVIYQPGQYGPVYNGSINKKPSQKVINNARYLLENGSICPSNVTGQNGIITGSGVYTSYYDSILGTTIYFCYT